MTEDLFKFFAPTSVGELNLDWLVDLLTASYGINPVINIGHLEKYNTSPARFGKRMTKRLGRQDFSELREYEVEAIVDEEERIERGRRIPYYRVRYAGYGPEEDLWHKQSGLKNAPEILRDWKRKENILTRRT